MSGSDSLKRHDKRNHEGPENTSPYPLARGAQAFDIVDVAREIKKADGMLGAVTGNQLRVIADQIRSLQEKAREILEDTKRSSDLHRARCNFKKHPGRMYHLYRRGEHSLYFSMLSPDDWGGSPPHAFEGSYRLEADMSWTPAEKVAEREARDPFRNGDMAALLALPPQRTGAPDESSGDPADE